MNLPSRRYTQDLRRYYRMPAVQVSLTLVLSLFVIAGFITFALRPTILSVVALRKTIAESQKTLQILLVKVSSLQKAEKQLESLSGSLPLLNTSIPNIGAQYAPLTLAVESLASQSGVTLESESLGSTLLFSRVLAPYKPSKMQRVVELPFNVRVSGSYPNVANFLTRLLGMERIVVSESITITREAGLKTAASSVAMNLSGKAFYLADPAQLSLPKNVGKRRGDGK